MFELVLDAPLNLVKAFAFTMPRLMAIFSMIPMLTRQSLPGMLRTGVVAGFGVLLMPTLIDPATRIAFDSADLMLLIAKEVLLGMAIGIVMAIPLWAMEGMGAFIDNQRGASIAQVLNPITGHDSSPLGELFSHAAITYLMVSGGLLIFLGAVYKSYEIWPVFAWLPQLDANAGLLLLQQLDRLMRLAVLLGSPVLIAMFLSEMGLALISRFAPQLQVFFLAMGIKSAVAMFVLAVYGATLFHYAHDEIMGIDGAIETVREMFVRGMR